MGVKSLMIQALGYAQNWRWHLGSHLFVMLKPIDMFDNIFFPESFKVRSEQM